MGVGRPLEGAKPKRRVSITADPDEWDEYKELITTKLPPGSSASSEIQRVPAKLQPALRKIYEEKKHVVPDIGVKIKEIAD